MPKPRIRRGLAVAIAVTTAAIATTAGSTSAYASHGGTGAILTSSNTGNSISFSDGTSVSAGEVVANAAWSPDGSTAVYVSDFGAIHAIRYNGGAPYSMIDSSTGVVARSHPTWSDGGYAIYWSEIPSVNAPWSIEVSTSASGWGYGQLTPDDGMDYSHPDAGPAGLLVAQRQTDVNGSPTGTPEVVKINTSTGAATVIIANASSPAVSPDGNHVTFVRSDGTNDQIWTSDMSGGNALQITSNAADHDNPTWSPDGGTIAFNTGSSGAVATASASGSDAAESPAVDGLNGMPAYEPQGKDHVVVLAGADRYGTAIAISQSHWATAGASGDVRAPAKSVTLSRSDTFADAISGSALAAC